MNLAKKIIDFLADPDKPQEYHPERPKEMGEPVTHLQQPGADDWEAACGNLYLDDGIDKDWEDVDCPDCMKTEAYIKAKNGSR